MEVALWACRFVQFAAAMLIFGTASFRLYGVATCDGTASGTLAAFDAWVRHLTLLAAITSLVSTLAFLLCQSATMAASPAAAIDPTALSAVLFETRFGRVWSWHLLIAVVLVLACLGRSRRRARAILILSLLLLASLAWIGHAAMAEGPAGIARELNQSAHLLAAGLWLGGLMPLGWLLRRARATDGDADLVLAHAAARHFSQMGYAAVALIALTGAVNSLLLVGSLEAMFGTAYGRLLAIKILLFLVMVGVAMVNRFHLAPRISHDPAVLGALCRTVGIEQGLGLSIIALVSILGTWPPAIHGGGR